MPLLDLSTVESREDRFVTCFLCGSEHLVGDVCISCGFCQRCDKIANHCTCKVSAYDRYVDADYQAYLEFKEGSYR